MKAVGIGGAIAWFVASCVPAVGRIEAPVRAAIRSHFGVDPGPSNESAVRAMLAQPLTRASVARITLARNPRIAAALAELEITAGQAAASRSLGRTDVDISTSISKDGSLAGIHTELFHDVLDLILAAPRARAGAAMLAATQARVTAEILAITARADDAFLAVAAATHEVSLARVVFDVANASADLVGRAHTAGGTTDLALAREQSMREEARIAVARADTTAEVARSELDAALGLTGDDTRWILGEGVPLIPPVPPSVDDLESASVAASLELVALRADALGAANRTRAANVAAWAPEISLGVAAEYHDGSWFPGPALRLGLPLISGERGRAAAERASARRIQHVTAAVAIEVRAHARAARMMALAAYDQARHLRDVLLPLRRRVLDETLLQYNAMNASPYELLLARRELANSEREEVDARRRFASAMRAVETLRRGASTPRAADTPLPTAPAHAPQRH